jgi:hypothetical protein
MNIPCTFGSYRTYGEIGDGPHSTGHIVAFLDTDNGYETVAIILAEDGRVLERGLAYVRWTSTPTPP